MAGNTQILAALGSDEPEVLRDAAHAAGESRCAEAIPRLAGLLASRSLGVQEAAETALRLIGGAETVRAVAPHLRSEDAPVRNLAMDILRAIGDQDFPTLVDLLHDDDPDIRIFASDILGSTDSVVAVPPLCEALLKDPEVNVRYQSAVSLGVLAFPEAAACLGKAMVDDEWVQFAVVEAIAKIRDESSVGALVKALGSSSELVVSMIVEALGDMGNIKAVPMLLRRMDGAAPALRNKIVKAVVVILGCRSLGLLPAKDRQVLAEGMLAALEDEEEDVQDAAVQGLAVLGGEEASRRILRLAGSMDPDRRDRVSAVQALASIGLTAALEDGLRSDVPAESLVAVETLARIGGAEAARLLMEAWPHRGSEEREAIVGALASFAGPEALGFFAELLAPRQSGPVLKAALGFLGRKAGRGEVEGKVFAFLSHPSDDVKEAALEACIALGGPAMLERFRNLFRTGDPLGRVMGIYALSRLDLDGNAEELREALEDEVPDIRKVALEALGKRIGEDQEALAMVVSKLTDENRDVRLAVVELLGRSEGGYALGPLRQALDDAEDWVRLRAVEALGRRGDRESVPSLVPLLDSGNKLLVIKTVEALGTIGGVDAFSTLLDVLGWDDPEVQSAAEDAVARLRECGRGGA